MATRAGVAEYSTSPSAQRSSERSIRASWTTGYWGADASIRASIVDACATTAPTISRASSPAPGSASTSARCRSRTAVRACAARSPPRTPPRARRRRPARGYRTRVAGRTLAAAQPPTPSTRTVTAPSSQAEQALDGGADGLADLRGRAAKVGARAGRRGAAVTSTPSVADADADRPARRGTSRQRGPAAADAQHAGHLERGQPRPSRGSRRGPTDRTRAAHGELPPADDRSRRRPLGRDAGLVAAAASVAQLLARSARHPLAGGRRRRPARVPIIRRRARPWVMITVPGRPSSGDPPTPRSRRRRGSGRCRPHAAGTPAGRGSTRWNSARNRSKMNADRPSKNLITTLPRTASHDDDVGHLPGQVLALDVAHEVEVGLVEQLGRPLDPGVALALLLADRQQRHARAGPRRARAR